MTTTKSTVLCTASISHDISFARRGSQVATSSFPAAGLPPGSRSARAGVLSPKWWPASQSWHHVFAAGFLELLWESAAFSGKQTLVWRQDCRGFLWRRKGGSGIAQEERSGHDAEEADRTQCLPGRGALQSEVCALEAPSWAEVDRPLCPGLAGHPPSTSLLERVWPWLKGSRLTTLPKLNSVWRKDVSDSALLHSHSYHQFRYSGPSVSAVFASRGFRGGKF